MPALTVHKNVWANSPYVAGQQLVLNTPDNSTLVLRCIVVGESEADMQAKVGTLVQAVTQQMAYQISLTFDAATYAWNCYTADVQVAFNQFFMFAFIAPVYITCPRDPTPVSGPI